MIFCIPKNIPEDTPDRVKYFIHLLFTKPRRFKKSDDMENKYIPIHSMRFREIFGRYNEEKYKRILLSYCDVNSSYSSGLEVKMAPHLSQKPFPKTYMLKDKYYYSLMRCDVPSDKLLIQKIRKEFDEEFEHDLTTWQLKLKLNNLELLKEEAEKYVLNDECINYLKKKYPDISRRKIIDKQNARLIKISLWNENHVFRDDFSGRLHSKLTSLPKDLRKFLRYNNEELISIDICNSQPFILAALLNHPAGYNNLLVSNKIKILYDEKMDIKSESPISSLSPSSPPSGLCLAPVSSLSPAEQPYYYYNMLDGHEAKNRPEDLKCYIKLAADGNLYEHIATELNMSRKRAKRQAMSMLFNQNEDRNNQLAKYFKECFPTVYHAIEHHKDHREPFHSQQHSKFQDKQRRNLPTCSCHIQLSQKLQEIESKIIIDKVCRKILDKDVNIPIFTIHDSILTTNHSVDFCKSLIRDEFDKWFGIKPQFKIINLSEDDDGE